MITSTPGRMPTIAFSDEADNDTLLSVLTYDWCVALVLRDGTQVEVSLHPPAAGSDLDIIGGKTWNFARPVNQQDWNGPEFYVPIDDVVQIIVL